MDGNVDCGRPDDTEGASTAVNGSFYLAVVTYECLHGYRHLSGNLTRVCQSDGRWSGQTPVCLYESDRTSSVLARDIVFGSLGGFCLIFLLLLPIDFLLYMRKRKKRRWTRYHGEFARHKMYVPVNMYGVVRAAINAELPTVEISRDSSSDRSPEPSRARVRQSLHDWQPPDIRLRDVHRPKRGRRSSRINTRQVAPLASSCRLDPAADELSGDEDRSLNRRERADSVEDQRRHRSRRQLPKLEVNRMPVEETYYLKNEVLLDIMAEPIGRPLPVAIIATNVRTKRKARRIKMAADARYKDDTVFEVPVHDSATIGDIRDYSIATLTSLPV